MLISAMKDHGDDYTSTDQYKESQDFDDLVDDEAHNGGASEQDHGSLHQDLINDEQQDENECFSSSDQSRYASQSLISNSGFNFQAELSGNDSKGLDNYNNANEYVSISADSSIGWNTKTAPKFYVNCKVHHALVVDTKPAGSSEESLSSSACLKINRQPKMRKKAKECVLNEEEDSGLVSVLQSASV